MIAIFEQLAVPNGFGRGLGAMQLILYFIYCEKNRDGGFKMTSDGSDSELGLKKKPQQSQAQAQRSNTNIQNGSV
ncbi:hypothetical protein Nepgr_002710 [Nepenthes gracilis]|uniref:Uncharacterized protein n=1 Tax=Nepenthes gracilis TaxID=150966 RepID=A0AAD3P7C4_NEPGR|nr:hypothetical protein Nepgr_002710 [Nepenthes gracilis]